MGCNSTLRDDNWGQIYSWTTTSPLSWINKLIVWLNVGPKLQPLQFTSTSKLCGDGKIMWMENVIMDQIDYFLWWKLELIESENLAKCLFFLNTLFFWTLQNPNLNFVALPVEMAKSSMLNAGRIEWPTLDLWGSFAMNQQLMWSILN